MRNTNFPWRVAEAGEIVASPRTSPNGKPYVYVADSDCIVDASGVVVLEATSWTRGVNNLHHIVECVNQCNGF